jgi:hypothetical protein
MLAAVVLVSYARGDDGAEATTRATSDKSVTAAFLDLDGSPLAALLEERLLGNPRAEWLERNAIDKIQRERQFTGMMDAAAVRRRAAVGKLLKAELLVLLRTSCEPVKSARLVVCESTHGLRLANHTLPLTDDMPTDLAALETAVNRAIEKHRARITEIVAVPSLASQDLSYEYDHLQGAYARLVEQAILDRPGMLVVELPEARAIAAELAAAGTTGVVRRPLPLYLLGEFRHEDKDGASQVHLKVRVLRGKDKLGQRDGAVEAQQAAAFLRRAVQELLDETTGVRQKLPLPRQEASRLAERAALFQRIGQWEQAAPLIEASLLLAPDQERRRQAVIIYGNLCRTFWLDASRSAEDNVQGLHFYLRGLEHLELFLRTADDVSKYSTESQAHFIYDFRGSVNRMHLSAGRSEELSPHVEQAKKKEHEFLLRIVRMRARDGRGDDAMYVPWALHHLSQQDRFDLIYRLLVELKDLPGLAGRVQQYALMGMTAGVLDCPEGREFLVRLEQSPNATFQSVARSLHRQLAADKARFRPPMVTVRHATIPDSQAVQFKPIEFTAVTRDGKSRKVTGLLGCVPSAHGLEDIAWDKQHLYVMRDTGELRELWTSDEPGLRIEDVVYDGRHAWAAAGRYGRRPLLLRLDPPTATTWKVTEVSGLPCEPPGNLPPYFRQIVAVAPVAPGRACVAGWFGRSWIALVDVDPRDPHRTSVEVIHEARKAIDKEDREQWKDTRVVFRPIYMFPLWDKPLTDPTAKRRIVVGRGETYADTNMAKHPLLVDPRNRHVTVLQPGLPNPVAVADFTWKEGAVYFVQVGPQHKHLYVYRLGSPEWKPEPVVPDVPFGWPVFHDGHLHVAGRQWWKVGQDGQIELLGEVPWYLRERFTAPSQRDPNNTRFEKVGPGTICLQAMYHSRHHGLLATGQVNAAGGKLVTYQIVLEDE